MLVSQLLKLKINSAEHPSFEEETMRDYLFFDNMLTPRLITAVYWLNLLIVIFTGLGMMLKGGAGGAVLGLLFIPVGFLFVRVICEILILTFKIHENVKKMADK